MDGFSIRKTTRSSSAMPGATNDVSRTKISRGVSPTSVRTSTIDSSNVKKNYQVYRGMSPTSATRLENRLKELEELLEQEREAHSRTQRELSDVQIQFDAFYDRIDEADNQLASHVDGIRKKDLEIQKLRKDLELANAQYEANELSCKKKFQDIINDLSDQLERTNKQKTKAEKDKHQLTIEIDGLAANLDGTNKAKMHLEGKYSDIEDQMRRLKLQFDETNKANNDLKANRDRLQHENSELSIQLHDYELNNGNYAKSKSQFQIQLDEAKNKWEEENRIRLQCEAQLNNLQSEFDRLSNQFEDEAEGSEGLRNQMSKLQAEYLLLKNKYDKENILRSDELEDLRRKMNARIVELEGIAEQARNRGVKLEKEKNKLTIEIKDISLQLDDANVMINDCTKRLKQAEHVGGDLQKRVGELTSDLSNSNSENTKLLAELTRMKTQISDLQSKVDQLTRENSKLNDALRESEIANKDLNKNLSENSSIRIQLQNERDSILSELGDTKESYRDLQSKYDVLINQVNSLKADCDLKLRQKDEELENSLHSSKITIDELNRLLGDLEAKSRSELSRLRKKYESENHEILIQIDSLNRSNADLTKNNKTLGNRLKEFETTLELERKNSQELRDSASVFERKLIAFQTEIDELQTMLEASEKGRKIAENELSDLTSHSNEINITMTAYVNDKRRLEADLQNLQRELDDANSSRRIAEDRADHMSVEMQRLSDQLRAESERSLNAENIRKQLETQIREISFKLEEYESSKDGRKVVGKLQNRIRELELELDAEQRRHKDAHADVRKYSKMVSDLKIQNENEHRLVIELTDEVNVLQNRLIALRKQIEEQEDVLGITMGKYRKTQQLLEDAKKKKVPTATLR